MGARLGQTDRQTDIGIGIDRKISPERNRQTSSKESQMKDTVHSHGFAV